MGKIDDRVARRPDVTRPEQAALGLLDELLGALDGSGMSRRRIAGLTGVSGAALSAWSRHDGWPSMWPLARVAAAVGMRLAWQPEAGTPPSGLGADGGRQLAISGLALPPDSSVRGWWPGEACSGDAVEVSLVRLGADIAWRRVHVLRWEVAQCARAAEVDVLTWKSVEAGLVRRGGKASSPGLDKLARAASVVAWEPWPAEVPGTTPLGWRSVDAPMPLAPWQRAGEEARDNLTLRHFRQARGRGDG